MRRFETNFWQLLSNKNCNILHSFKSKTGYFTYIISPTPPMSIKRDRHCHHHHFLHDKSDFVKLHNLQLSELRFKSKIPDSNSISFTLLYWFNTFPSHAESHYSQDLLENVGSLNVKHGLPRPTSHLYVTSFHSRDRCWKILVKFFLLQPILLTSYAF